MNRPWPENVAHYLGRNDTDSSLLAMRDLSQHIADGPLAAGLYGWTSMFDLCITQVAAIYPYEGPFLKISPLSNGDIEFRYIDTYETERQWNRQVAVSEAISRLHKFLDQLRWFPRESLLL